MGKCYLEVGKCYLEVSPLWLKVWDKNPCRYHNIFVQFGRPVFHSFREFHQEKYVELFHMKYWSLSFSLSPTIGWLETTAKFNLSWTWTGKFTSTRTITLKLRPCLGVSLLVCLAGRIHVRQHLVSFFPEIFRLNEWFARALFLYVF